MMFFTPGPLFRSLHCRLRQHVCVTGLTGVICGFGVGGVDVTYAIALEKWKEKLSA